MPARRTSTVLVALVATAVAGCTDHHEPAPPRPTATAPPDGRPSTPTPAGQTIPPVTPGELTRRVFSSTRDETIGRRSPRPGTTYGLQAACTSESPGGALTYEVSGPATGSSAGLVVAGSVSCGDSEVRNELGSNLPAGPLEIELSAGLHDVSSGYVVIAPMAELHP